MYMIRAFGEKIEGDIKFREQVYRELVQGDLPEGDFNRNARLIHALQPGIPVMLSHFVRFDPKARAIAQRVIGPNASLQKSKLK